MESFWKRQRRLYVKPWLNKFNSWKHVSYNGTRVYFKKHLDGGGNDFGQDVIAFLKLRQIPRQQRIFEWCAGPGFIGFSLLAHGLAETLCLADVNPEAVEACRRTVRENGLDSGSRFIVPIIWPIFQRRKRGTSSSAIRRIWPMTGSATCALMTAVGTFIATFSQESSAFLNRAALLCSKRTTAVPPLKPSGR